MLRAICFVLLLQNSGQNKVSPDQLADQIREITGAEAQFSQIAESRAQHDRVRDFARMLERDQTQIENARQKPSTGNISPLSVPVTKDHQKKADHLSRLSGEEFDRVYIDTIIKEHQKAIKLAEQMDDQ